MAHKHTNPPADLDDESRRLFRRLAGDLRAQRDGAESDMILLGEAIRLRARLAQVRATLDQDGPTVLGSKQQVRPHPLIAVEQNLARDLRNSFDQLRLSPAKRSDAFHVTAAGRLVDPFADELDYDDDE